MNAPVDQNTLDVMKVMGVEVDTKREVQPRQYTFQEIQDFLKNLDNTPAPELIPAPAADPAPAAAADPIPAEPKADPVNTPNPSEPQWDSFEQILKDLEDLSKDREDAATKAKETQQLITDKVAEVKAWDSSSETFKEIVQLNAKLQTELETYKNSDAAQKAKIKELSDKVNFYELDDTRVNVPEDLRWATKHLINFYESKNDSFKIKAMEELVRAIEKLGWRPIGPYVDDVVAEQLKAISSLSGDWAPMPVAEPKQVSDLDRYIQAHWIPKEL